MQPPTEYTFKHKGFYFQPDLVTAEYLDSLEQFEIRDSDVFLVTYPKSAPIEEKPQLIELQQKVLSPEAPLRTVRFYSWHKFHVDAHFFRGTAWTQNILSLIYHEGQRNGTEDTDLLDRVPFLEYNLRSMDYISRPSPRLFASHLPYYLVPKGLRSRRAKVIYVSRNPKDVLVSYYHFSRYATKIETAGDFGDFMEKFLAGKVLASSWLDHVEGWYTHKDDFNILFLTYEEMKKDLRSSALKIRSFLGKKLTEEELDVVVDKATFEKMKMDPRTNYENMPNEILEKGKGHFLRKGTVGDWKNTMTVAQSERFDRVLKERMQNLSLRYCWDINEDLPS